MFQFQQIKKKSSQAIQQSYDLPPNQQNEDLMLAPEKPQDEQIEYNEDMLLMQIECCEDEQSILDFLDVEQLDSQLNNDYKNLYTNMKSKAFLAMKTVLKLLKEKKNCTEGQDVQQLENLESHTSIQKKYLQLKQLHNERESENEILKIKLQKQEAVIDQEKQQAESKMKQMLLENIQQIADLSLRTEKLEMDNSLLKQQLQQSQMSEEYLRSLSLEEVSSAEQLLQQQLEAVRQRKNELISQLQKQNSQLKQESVNRKLCVICQERPISILLRPCNHFCVCSNCSDNILQCPMDRQHISQKEKIYISTF